jgi:hypothetical protein
VAIDGQRLSEIREGRRGIALGLYIDVDDDDWEEYCLSVPTVLALEEGTGRRVIDALREALEVGAAQEVSDDASEAVSMVLASSLKDQAFVARMLEGLAGRPDDTFGWKLAPAS